MDIPNSKLRGAMNMLDGRPICQVCDHQSEALRVIEMLQWPDFTKRARVEACMACADCYDRAESEDMLIACAECLTEVPASAPWSSLDGDGSTCCYRCL